VSSDDQGNKPSASIKCREFLKYLVTFTLSRSNMLRGVKYLI